MSNNRSKIGFFAGYNGGERVRDKIAASKKKRIWMGGVPVGYRLEDRKLLVEDSEAAVVD